jgi:acetylornithine deacetylase/succinyl-diaminopimelate desuccinylase-like protein
MAFLLMAAGWGSVPVVSAVSVVSADEAIPLALSPARIALLRARIEDDLPGIVRRWISLSEVPSPSGGESARAARMEKEFRDLGLDEVHRDEIGNVMGILRGRSRSAKRVVYAAHLDTVAKEEDDVRVSRPDSGRLQGPGIRDDASGLIGLLEAGRCLKQMNILPPGDVWLLATVQEEIGLLGARKFLDDNASRVGRFVAVDGELGEIGYGATGILWLKIHFLTEGAHTLKSPGLPSANLAAARAIEDIYRINFPGTPETRESWLNVSMMGGADVVNAMAHDAWLTVDLRSNSPLVLRRLADEVRGAAWRAAKRTRVELKIETLLSIPGAVPVEGENSPFVKLAVEALVAAGRDRPSPMLRGTADHNRALERGIPGLSIGVTRGAGIHTPRETADIEPLPQGIAALAAMMASLPAE